MQTSWLYLLEQKLRDVTSHTFAQSTHVALTPPKLSCGVGSRTQSTTPSFIKISSGDRSYTLRESGILHFSAP